MYDMKGRVIEMENKVNTFIDSQNNEGIYKILIQRRGSPRNNVLGLCISL